MLQIIQKNYWKDKGDSMQFKSIHIDNQSKKRERYERRVGTKFLSVSKNTNDWYSGLDRGKLVGLTFIDLKKHWRQLAMVFFASN